MWDSNRSLIKSDLEDMRWDANYLEVVYQSSKDLLNLAILDDGGVDIYLIFPDVRPTWNISGLIYDIRDMTSFNETYGIEVQFISNDKVVFTTDIPNDNFVTQRVNFNSISGITSIKLTFAGIPTYTNLGLYTFKLE